MDRIRFVARQTGNGNSSFVEKGDNTEEFNSPALRNKVSESISGLFNSDNFSDVTLVVRNRSFKANRLILSSSSSYFKGMFMCGMKESSEREVEFNDFDPDIFEQVVRFLYTGKIEMSPSNIQDLFEVSNMMQIDHLIDGCAGYMWKHINANNCLDVWNFSIGMSQTRLAKKAKEFACNNLHKIVQHDEWFKSMKIDNLTELLQSDILVTNNEDSVCAIALKWASFSGGQQYLKRLLESIRLPYLDTKYIKYSLMTDPMITARPECVQLLQEALDYHLFKGCLNIKSMYPRLTQNREMNVLVFDKGTRDVVAYSLQRPGESRVLTQLPSEFSPEKFRWFTVCSVGNDFYIFKKNGSVCRLWTCNTNQINWQKCKNILTFRTAFSVVAIQDKLYVIGGLSTVDNTSTDIVEEFDTRTFELTRVGKLCKPVYNMAAVAYKGDIFIFGGKVKPEISNNDTTCDVQRFSTVGKFTCYSEQPIDTSKKNVKAVVYHDKAILFCSKYFVYNLEDKSYICVGPVIFHPLDCFISNDNIYIVGGHLKPNNCKSCQKDIIRCISAESLVGGKWDQWGDLARALDLKHKDPISGSVIVELKNRFTGVNTQPQL